MPSPKKLGSNPNGICRNGGRTGFSEPFEADGSNMVAKAAENGLKTPVFGADKADGRRNSRDGASKRR